MRLRLRLGINLRRSRQRGKQAARRRRQLQLYLVSNPFFSALVHNHPILVVKSLFWSENPSSFQTRHSLHLLAYNPSLTLVCPFTAPPLPSIPLFPSTPSSSLYLTSFLPAFVLSPHDCRKHDIHDVFKTQGDYLWCVCVSKLEPSPSERGLTQDCPSPSLSDHAYNRSLLPPLALIQAV